MKTDKTSRLKMEEFTDSEFLSFLYSEREREESLNTYQGWNIWAIAGALITILCAGYNLLSQHYDEISFLRSGYILSGIMAFLLCYRPYSLIFVHLFSRERSVDYHRVRTLREVVPKSYMFLTLICSVGLSLFFLLVDKTQPWSIVTVFWIISAVLYISVTVSVIVNKDQIVKSYMGEMLFADVKQDVLFSSIMGSVLSLVWLQSFKKVEGSFMGDPDFEIAICAAAILLLVYLLLKMLIDVKKTSHLDVLLDDLIYKGRSKESVFQHLLIYRMGYDVLEACAHELYSMKQTFDAFESKKEKLILMNSQLSKGEFDFNQVFDYCRIINDVSKFTEDCECQVKGLDVKLKQLVKQVPELESQDGYKDLIELEKTLLDKEKEMLDIMKPAKKSLQMWIDVYHCRKYGGWCVRDCALRNSRQSLGFRFELYMMKSFPRLFSTLRKNKNCKDAKLA